jgi:hypothetical protein
MTTFQEYVREYAKGDIKKAWEAFKSMYPDLKRNKAKYQFEKEVSQLFFAGKGHN